jgi:hypothetical protein
VGSLLGALLGGYALLFWLDLHDTYRLSVLALALSAAILTTSVFPRRTAIAVVAFAAALVTVAVQPAWPPERLSAGLFRERSLVSVAGDGPDAFFERYRSGWGEYVLFHRDDPSTSVLVHDRPGRGGGRVRGLWTNGKNDSSIPTDDVTTGLLALLPALLAEKAERAFVIGYGTGFSVGKLAALDSVHEIAVAEISPGVVEAAPLFEGLNGGAVRSPKTRIIRSDAYRALLRSDGRFDVIVSEPSNPWMVGVEQLYSREFLRAARARLAPGGVFAQWIHSYEMNRKTLGIVFRTYRDAFDAVAVWYGRGPDLILLGFENGAHRIDLERVEERWEREGFEPLVRALPVPTFESLLAHELLPLGVLAAADLPYPAHTMARPILSHEAARAFFEGKSAPLPVEPSRETATLGAEASLLRRYRARRGRPPSSVERGTVILEVCRHRLELCAVEIAQWQNEEPRSPELAALVPVVRASGKHAAAVHPELRKTLSIFFGRGSLDELAPRYETLRLFFELYSYAAPFDLDVLDGIRARCASDPRCRAEAGP